MDGRRLGLLVIDRLGELDGSGEGRIGRFVGLSCCVGLSDACSVGKGDGRSSLGFDGRPDVVGSAVLTGAFVGSVGEGDAVEGISDGTFEGKEDVFGADGELVGVERVGLSDGVAKQIGGSLSVGLAVGVRSGSKSITEQEAASNTVQAFPHTTSMSLSRSKIPLHWVLPEAKLVSSRMTVDVSFMLTAPSEFWTKHDLEMAMLPPFDT